METFLGARAAVPAIHHLHLPKAFAEQEPLHAHAGSRNPQGRSAGLPAWRGTGPAAAHNSASGTYTGKDRSWRTTPSTSSLTKTSSDLELTQLLLPCRTALLGCCSSQGHVAIRTGYSPKPCHNQINQPSRT